MTYPMPNPNPNPTEPRGPREMAVGSALYLGQYDRHEPCPQCEDLLCLGNPALRAYHEDIDRVSEYTRLAKERGLR